MGASAGQIGFFGLDAHLTQTLGKLLCSLLCRARRRFCIPCLLFCLLHPPTQFHIGHNLIVPCLPMENLSVYGSIFVPSTCRNFVSHSGCAGHAGAVTRLPSTTALSTGMSTYSPPAALTSGPTAG